MFVNVHTHKDLDKGTVGIMNIGDYNIMPNSSYLYSVGIHPWDALESTWSNNLNDIIEIAKNKHVVAIGECGFDSLKGDINVQNILFKKHILLSEALRKPLIIHSVGGHSKVLEIKKQLNPTQKWLLHSVIANSDLGRQFSRANIYCSFSLSSLQNLKTIELLKTYPPHLIFFETDDSTISIDKIYTFAATILNCDVESLKKQCYLNFREFIGDGKLAGENPDNGWEGKFRET